MSQTGLRERKKLMNQIAIEDAALRLFQQRGYEETSIQDIADAVTMSPRTFFRYFSSKEEVLYAPTQAIFNEAIAFLRQYQSGRPLQEVLYATFAHMATLYQQQNTRFLTIYRITTVTPTLQMNYFYYLAMLEPRLCAALLQYEQHAAMRLSERGIQLLVATSMTAFRIALQQWLENGATDNVVPLAHTYLELLLNGDLLSHAALD